jgi:hypothetical protein
MARSGFAPADRQAGDTLSDQDTRLSFANKDDFEFIGWRSGKGVAALQF